MLTVSCVLRTGGEYTPYHVEALARGIRRHLTIPHRIVCLTDVPTKMPKGVDGIRLPDPWGHWWSKICLFKKGLLEGPVFFLDLDTILIGNIDDLVLDHRFTVLENFWSSDRIGSGLMAWDCDLSHIYDEFKKNPQQFIDTYKTRDRWGDQGFITYHSPVKWELWQKKHPGKVVSWKMHCKRSIPFDARIVCFHGQPRPWLSPLWSEVMKYESEQA